MFVIYSSALQLCYNRCTRKNIFSTFENRSLRFFAFGSLIIGYLHKNKFFFFQFIIIELFIYNYCAELDIDKNLLFL